MTQEEQLSLIKYLNDASGARNALYPVVNTPGFGVHSPQSMLQGTLTGSVFDFVNAAFLGGKYRLPAFMQPDTRTLNDIINQTSADSMYNTLALSDITSAGEALATGMTNGTGMFGGIFTDDSDLGKSYREFVGQMTSPTWAPLVTRPVANFFSPGRGAVNAALMQSGKAIGNRYGFDRNSMSSGLSLLGDSVRRSIYSANGLTLDNSQTYGLTEPEIAEAVSTMAAYGGLDDTSFSKVSKNLSTIRKEGWTDSEGNQHAGTDYIRERYNIARKSKDREDEVTRILTAEGAENTIKDSGLSEEAKAAIDNNRIAIEDSFQRQSLGYGTVAVSQAEDYARLKRAASAGNVDHKVKDALNAKAEEIRKNLAKQGVDETAFASLVQGATERNSAYENTEMLISGSDLKTEDKEKLRKYTRAQYDRNSGKFNSVDSQIEELSRELELGNQQESNTVQDFESVVKEKIKNLNKCVSSMKNLFGSAAAAKQAMEQIYGESAFSNIETQNRITANADALTVAANTLGIDPRSAGMMWSQTSASNLRAMGYSELERNLGYGTMYSAGMALGYTTRGFQFAENMGLSGMRDIARVNSAMEERSNAAAGSQQSAYQTYLRYALKTGKITEEEYQKYSREQMTGSLEERERSARELFSRVEEGGTSEERENRGFENINNAEAIKLMRENMNDEELQDVQNNVMAAAQAEDVRIKREASLERRENIASEILNSSGMTDDTISAIRSEGIKSELEEISDIEGGKELLQYKEGVYNKKLEEYRKSMPYEEAELRAEEDAVKAAQNAASTFGGTRLSDAVRNAIEEGGVSALEARAQSIGAANISGYGNIKDILVGSKGATTDDNHITGNVFRDVMGVLGSDTVQSGLDEDTVTKIRDINKLVGTNPEEAAKQLNALLGSDSFKNSLPLVKKILGGRDYTERGNSSAINDIIDSANAAASRGVTSLPSVSMFLSENQEALSKIAKNPEKYQNRIKEYREKLEQAIGDGMADTDKQRLADAIFKDPKKFKLLFMKQSELTAMNPDELLKLTEEAGFDASKILKKDENGNVTGLDFEAAVGELVDAASGGTSEGTTGSGGASDTTSGTGTSGSASGPNPSKVESPQQPESGGKPETSTGYTEDKPMHVNIVSVSKGATESLSEGIGASVALQSFGFGD